MSTSTTTPIVTSADADAFMRKYLTQPTDVTARLVFADWLEETGVPHNIAWAYYIRLKAEANLHDSDSDECDERNREADEYAPKIRANLTIPAALFVGYPKSLLQLLPASNITVRLAEFAVPIEVLEYMPESVARANLVLPLDVQGRTLLVAIADPHDRDTTQKVEFILNRSIVGVRAERHDLQAALDREYGNVVYETVESVSYEYPGPLTEILESQSFSELTTDPASPVVRLVNLIIQEAINLRADRILVTPEPDGGAVRFRIGGQWIDRDFMPLRLLIPVTTRIALMAQIPVEWASANPPSLMPLTGGFPMLIHGAHFRVRVTIQPSPDGPTTQIDLTREPVAAA